MKRRTFITLLGGAAAAWPLAARAQQPGMPVIGFRSSLSAPVTSKRIASFGHGLSETGYVAGRDVTVGARMAEGQYDRLPALAADLVARRVDLIAALAPPAAFAAKAATTTIPIVFVGALDPVKAGLVASLNRPGGNVTGVTFIGSSLGAKRLGLLHELLPGAARVAVLVNPKNRVSTETLIKDVQSAAATIGRQIEVYSASTNREIDTAFASLVQKRADALMVGADPVFVDRRVQLATLAARHMLPAIAVARDFAEAGLLMSYGASNPDRYRQIGIYTGRILKGEKPADLPVMQSTRFELVINVQTAKLLGLDVPPMLLARADEVIE